MIQILNIALSGILVFGGVVGLPTDARENALDTLTVKEIKSVRLTAYNAVPEQTNEDPSITASGAKSNPEVVIARSRDMTSDLPYGTIVALTTPTNKKSCGFNEVEHLIGYRVVADTMHKRKTKQIDVMFGANDRVSLGEKSLNPAIVMGICEVSVSVVGKVDIKDIPSTQRELARIVEKGLNG